MTSAVSLPVKDHEDTGPYDREAHENDRATSEEFLHRTLPSRLWRDI